MNNGGGSAVRAVVVGVALLGFTLGACSDTDDGAAISPASTVPVTSDPGEVPGSGTPVPTDLPTTPDPGRPQIEDDPAPTAGPLDLTAMPEPSALGPGWRYRIDPGSEEDGYSTSGEPATARDPVEVVVGLAPYGCPDLDVPPELPEPAYALEVTYGHRPGDEPAVGLVLDFASSDEASAFLSTYLDAQAACSGGQAAVDGFTGVEVVSRDASGALLRRLEAGTAGPWVEAVDLSSAQVRLLAYLETSGTQATAARLRPALSEAA
jgi:hypothetical protein